MEVVAFGAALVVAAGGGVSAVCEGQLPAISAWNSTSVCVYICIHTYTPHTYPSMKIQLTLCTQSGSGHDDKLLRGEANRALGDTNDRVNAGALSECTSAHYIWRYFDAGG